MSAILDAYSYYVSSSYPTAKTNRYDSHKRSELKTLYNNIVKYNKDLPIYAFKMDNNMSKFAIDIKESAHSLKNTIFSLSSDEDSSEGIFSKRTAYSDNEDVVSVSYLPDSIDSSSSGFSIEVNKLACTQINTGHFLPNRTTTLEPGNYSFDLNAGNAGYEFQFSIKNGDSNQHIQNKLAALINRADIGIIAGLSIDRFGKSALTLETENTGCISNDTPMFSINETSETLLSGSVDYFGLDNISQKAENSDFLLNGIRKSSRANTFTINNNYEVTLNDVSKDNVAVNINLKTNVDSISDNINTLVDAYNGVITTVSQYTDSQSGSSKLINDLGSTAKSLRNELEPIGLNVAANGSICVDDNLLTDATSDKDNLNEIYSILGKFKQSITNQADTIMFDPMQYANKTLIAYKNPGHSFISPYFTSLYSGMIFSSYC